MNCYKVYQNNLLIRCTSHAMKYFNNGFWICEQLLYVALYDIIEDVSKAIYAENGQIVQCFVGFNDFAKNQGELKTNDPRITKKLNKKVKLLSNCIVFQSRTLAFGTDAVLYLHISA